ARPFLSLSWRSPFESVVTMTHARWETAARRRVISLELSKNAEGEPAGGGGFAAGRHAFHHQGVITERQEAGGEAQAQGVVIVGLEVRPVADLAVIAVQQSGAVPLESSIDLRSEDDPARRRPAQLLGRRFRGRFGAALLVEEEDGKVPLRLLHLSELLDGLLVGFALAGELAPAGVEVRAQGPGRGRTLAVRRPGDLGLAPSPAAFGAHIKARAAGEHREHEQSRKQDPRLTPAAEARQPGQQREL